MKFNNRYFIVSETKSFRYNRGGSGELPARQRLSVAMAGGGVPPCRKTGFRRRRKRQKPRVSGEHNLRALANKYVLLRHGQTIHQTKERDQTYNWPDKPPVKLTKKGEGQIKKAAKKLKRERIHLIYSSDIFRTRQTANIVARELGLRISFDKRLRDINLGIYHGRPKKEFYQAFPDRKKRFYKKPPKGESWSECRKRVVSFIKDIDKKYKNKKILIISHGDPLWLLEGVFKGLSNEKLLKELSQGDYIKVGELRKISY